jgi:DtxR family Mn-dependent transcriptional regulator
VKITVSKENYLKAIAEAESEGEPVIPATLARWLNVSAPAVTMAIKRLKRDALIRTGRDGTLSLTAAGRDIANRLLNRHHLIERMLTEIFGMEWYKVHDEAEQLEHAVSADFERRLLDRLGTGEACPHGNRVEGDTPQDRRDRGLRPLDEAGDLSRHRQRFPKAHGPQYRGCAFGSREGKCGSRGVAGAFGAWVRGPGEADGSRAGIVSDVGGILSSVDANGLMPLRYSNRDRDRLYADRIPRSSLCPTAIEKVSWLRSHRGFDTRSRHRCK